jgi:salicylate hydroxylase
MIRFLRTLARSVGADIRFGAHVTSIDPDYHRVTMASGEVVSADVIVGADGAEGLTRSHLLPEPDNAAVEYIMYRSVRRTALIFWCLPAAL